MAKRYGKNIDMHKLVNKRPSNNLISPRLRNFIEKVNTTTQKNNKFYEPHRKQLPTGEGETSTHFATDNNRTPGLNNPFYLWLLDNSICRIAKKIIPGAAVSIDIANPTGHLGENLLRKGDYFYIYNNKTYQSIRLRSDLDLADNATSIRMVSNTFTIADIFNSGSFIVPDYKVQTQRLSNVPELKEYTLTNTEYKSLSSSPYTLLAAETGKLHIPLSATIIYNHGADEMTRADLYIGHNASLTSIGQYWSSLDEAFYRSRDSMLVQLSPGIYSAGAGTDYQMIPYKALRSTGSGLALKLYTSTNFTSASSYIKVILYYKTIVI
tara:strand:- start:8490 stop:9461 length:972 start_codon:yes stop_codon:yes gene_type:complete